jgi:hypothetical protein
MDKMGLGMLIGGIILILLGVGGIYVFLPKVIDFIMGGIGIAILLVGLVLAGIGAILVKD